MTKLLPCPFCGSVPYDFEDDWNEPPYLVSCPNRECVMDGVKTYSTKEQAIEAWNTRKSSDERKRRTLDVLED